MATAAETAVREARQFIGGEWVDAADGATFEDRDPYTATSSRPSPPEGRRTRAARSTPPRAAFPAWSATPPAERQSDLPQGRRHPREPPRRGRLDARARDRRDVRLRRCSRCTSSRASSGRRPRSAYAPIGQIIPSDNPGTFAMGLRKPVGVVGAIAPWNAALILSARSIAAPLALGNTVVLKPSEWSPVVRRPALGRDLRRGRACRTAC